MIDEISSERGMGEDYDVEIYLMNKNLWDSILSSFN
jgi:hypothetical protein